MSRITDPICDHARRGIVTNQPDRGKLTDCPHAATSVCAREACIEDAKFWVRAKTGMEPYHRPDGSR